MIVNKSIVLLSPYPQKPFCPLKKATLDRAYYQIIIAHNKDKQNY